MKHAGENLTIVVSVILVWYLLSTGYSNLLEGEIQRDMKSYIETMSSMGHSVQKELKDLNSRRPVDLLAAQARMTIAWTISALVVAGVVCGLLAGKVAETKGHNHSHWFFIGFFFSIIGLIAAAGIGKKPISGSN